MALARSTYLSIILCALTLGSSLSQATEKILSFRQLSAMPKEAQEQYISEVRQMMVELSRVNVNDPNKFFVDGRELQAPRNSSLGLLLSLPAHAQSRPTCAPTEELVSLGGGSYFCSKKMTRENNDCPSGQWVRSSGIVHCGTQLTNITENRNFQVYPTGAEKPPGRLNLPQPSLMSRVTGIFSGGGTRAASTQPNTKPASERTVRVSPLPETKFKATETAGIIERTRVSEPKAQPSQPAASSNGLLDPQSVGAQSTFGSRSEPVGPSPNSFSGGRALVASAAEETEADETSAQAPAPSARSVNAEDARAVMNPELMEKQSAPRAAQSAPAASNNARSVRDLPPTSNRRRRATVADLENLTAEQDARVRGNSRPQNTALPQPATAQETSQPAQPVQPAPRMTLGNAGAGEAPGQIGNRSLNDPARMDTQLPDSAKNNFKCLDEKDKNAWSKAGADYRKLRFNECIYAGNFVQFTGFENAADPKSLSGQCESPRSLPYGEKVVKCKNESQRLCNPLLFGVSDFIQKDGVETGAYGICVPRSATATVRCDQVAKSMEKAKKSKSLRGSAEGAQKSDWRWPVEGQWNEMAENLNKLCERDAFKATHCQACEVIQRRLGEANAKTQKYAKYWGGQAPAGGEAPKSKGRGVR